jgi:hypothetical protein
MVEIDGTARSELGFENMPSEMYVAGKPHDYSRGSKRVVELA